MRVAFEHVKPRKFDFHLWLNDDTYLFPDAIQRLLATEEQVRQTTGVPAIVAGTTQDPKTGKATYGGQRRRGRWSPFWLEVVKAASAPERCDTFNGNCVLVPREVYQTLGNLDASFRHAMGDTDYGFRAAKAGFGVWAAPGFAGTCVMDHTKQRTYFDVELPLRERFRHMFQPKGLPPRAWLTLTRRHCGPLWLLYFLWPYGKVIVTWALRAVRRQPRPVAGAASSRRNG
jgi:GT2 family glycosyltransferase